MNEEEKKYAFFMLAMVLVVAVVGLIVVVLPSHSVSNNDTIAGFATDISSVLKNKNSTTSAAVQADAALDDSPVNYLSCKDSDGGKNYAQFGVVKTKTSAGRQQLEDTCTPSKDENGLPVYITERYCGEYNRPQTTQYRCGGVCFANECEEIALVTRAEYATGEEIQLTQDFKSADEVCADMNRDCVMMYYRTLDGQFRELSANDCQTTPSVLAQELPLDNGYTTGIIAGQIFWFENYGVQYMNHTSSNAYMVNVYFPDGGQGINGPMIDGSTYCPQNFCFEFDSGGAVAHAYYQNNQGALTADVYAVCAD
ncbi:MAG: hypothetical protein ACLFNM_01115 [Candidatus Woesearchaeota archaeon]